MPSDRSDDGYEMFTLRVNMERPTTRARGSDAAETARPGRIRIQVKHVNSGDEETRFAVDEALDWLRGKIAALFHKRGGQVRPSDSSDPAQQ